LKFKIWYTQYQLQALIEFRRASSVLPVKEEYRKKSKI